METTDGDLALILVLGLMAELGRTTALTADQLDRVIKPALDLTHGYPQRQERLRSYQRTWAAKKRG